MKNEAICTTRVTLIGKVGRIVHFISIIKQEKIFESMINNDLQ